MSDSYESSEQNTKIVFQSDGIFVPGTFYKIHKISGESLAFRGCFSGKSSLTNWIVFNGYLEELDGGLCHLTFLHWDPMSEWSCYIPGNVNSREYLMVRGLLWCVKASSGPVWDWTGFLVSGKFAVWKWFYYCALTRDCSLQFSGPISSVL